MRPIPSLALSVLLFAGCGPQETGFQAAPEVQDDEQGEVHMEISPAELKIFDCLVGYAQSLTFSVTNIGEGELNIQSIKAVTGTNIFFFEEARDVVVSPAQDVEFVVVATLESEEPAYGELRIQSNELDNPNLLVPVAAFSLGWEGDTGITPGDTGGDSGTTGDSGG